MDYECCRAETDKERIERLLIEWLDTEVERHREAENAEATTWGRGFHNGSMTEAVMIRCGVRKLLEEDEP